MTPSEYPPPGFEAFAHDIHSSNVQVVHTHVHKFDSTAMFVVVFFSITTLVFGAVLGRNIAMQRQLERQSFDTSTKYQLMERRYMDFEAYAILNGWKVQKDESFGPTGNIERMAPKEK